MRKIQLIALMLCAVFMLGACGSGDSVEIKKEQADGNTAAQSGAQTVQGGEVTPAEGYVFTYKGTAIAPDMDMKELLAALGEPASYFEAESCAFQGLDKIYTYPDFEIDTYPQGDRDLVSMILFKDDLVETDEGIAIGMTLEDLQKAYAGAQVESGAVTLKKGNMQLMFLIQEGKVTSIEYDSLTAKQ